MARTINQEEHTAKCNEILDVAQRLVYTKGYERMTIQDIRTELDMSSGAFFHYFPSKPAVLEALVERMQQAAERPLLLIVHDPNLSALEKLRGYFALLDQSRAAQKAFIANLARVWFDDDNAIVREKVHEAIVERRVPLLTEIIWQGMREGTLTTPYPDQVGGIILALARGMGDTLTQLMLSFEQARDKEQIINEIVSIYGAYADALERLLGAPSGFLQRFDGETVREWLDVENTTTG